MLGADQPPRGSRYWQITTLADGEIPDARFVRTWLTVGSAARSMLQRGGKVLIHCRAGLGRTGTIAAKLLGELGSNPDDAIRPVRTARPQTIETGAQERYVRALTPRCSTLPAVPTGDRLTGSC